MIRIALCDDEQKILDSVSAHIQKYAENRQDDVFETVCFHSANTLLSALEDGKGFDIFLLDVYIGDAMGTDLAKIIRKKGIENPIIFLTTSIEHAPESFETGTLRYLIKPLDIRKLQEALDAALNQIEKMQGQKLIFKTENGMEKLSASQIVCSEARGHYQYITRIGGAQIRVRMTVAELYDQFCKHRGFIRVGSAYIVNLRNMKNITSSEMRLYQDIVIPTPRGKYTEIKNAFWNFQYQGQED